MLIVNDYEFELLRQKTGWSEQERFVFAHMGLIGAEEAPLRIECHRAGPWSGRGTDSSGRDRLDDSQDGADTVAVTDRLDVAVPA